MSTSPPEQNHLMNLDFLVRPDTMNALSGVNIFPIQPISVVDVFFPGFSAVTASTQQLLVNTHCYDEVYNIVTS